MPIPDISTNVSDVLVILTPNMDRMCLIDISKLQNTGPPARKYDQLQGQAPIPNKFKLRNIISNPKAPH